MEHDQMINCQCSEADQLGFLCLACGKTRLPDPSWIVIGLAVVMFGANLVYWIVP